jgi:hypothetical protein
LAFLRIVSSGYGDETILLRDETIFRFWRRTPETADGYQVGNKTADSVGGENRRQSNANLQFHPCLCLRAGCSLDRWFLGN